MTKRSFLLFLSTAILLITVTAQVPTKQTTTTMPADTTKPKKPASISDKVKTSSKIEGLFTLYQDTTSGSLQVYVKKSQLEKEFIYQSFSINGPTALFLNQSMHRATFVFKVQKSFDKLEFARVNTSFWYDPANAVSKTKDVDKPDAVFYSDKVVAEDEGGYLVTADGLFLSEKLDPVKPILTPGPLAAFTFNLGSLNAAKSKYARLRSFPGNTDIVVDLAYDNPNTLVSGGPDITDARYIRATAY